MALYPIFLGLALAMQQPDLSPFAQVWDYIWLGFAILSPINIVYFNVHGKRVVPGAQDNLSGCVCAYGAAKALADGDGNSTLQHTRIMAVAFGAEETGLKGSKAFVKNNLKWLKDNNVSVINLDGIMTDESVNIITKEPMTMVKYPQSHLDEVHAAFEAEGVDAVQTNLPIGATDGSAFGMKDITATTIVAFPMQKLHPTYHTRRDTPDYIDPQMLENMQRVLVRFAEDADAKL